MSETNRIVFLGTYSTHPRQRLLLEAAENSDHDIIQCHFDVWGNIKDKSQVKGIQNKLRILIRMVIAYPILLFKYLTLPRHNIVVFMHMGLLDVLVLGPLALLLRRKLFWDVYISLYDTVIRDRKILSPNNPAAWILYAMEWVALRIVHTPFLDTESHAKYIAALYNISAGKVSHIHVGVDSLFMNNSYDCLFETKEKSPTIKILFYGQFIPLHGIETIIDAALLLKKASVNFELQLIGKGQLSDRIDKRINEHNLTEIHRVSWVPYEKLLDEICNADICLGIFGTSQKAHNVIPNKIFQIMSTGNCFITMDSPAIRELVECTDTSNCILVPAGSAKELADAIQTLYRRSRKFKKQDWMKRVYGLSYIEEQFMNILQS